MAGKYQELTRKKAIILASIVVAVISSVLFLVAEVYVRLTMDNTNLWALTGRKIGVNPASTWAFVDAYSAIRGRPGIFSIEPKKSINSHGFISTPEISVEKPDDVTRVVFLGGSSTAGCLRLLLGRSLRHNVAVVGVDPAGGRLSGTGVDVLALPGADRGDDAEAHPSFGGAT